MGIVIVHVPGRARPVELAAGDSVTFGRGGGELEVGIEKPGTPCRGSNAASPSARYRATSLLTQPWDTSYRRAASPWLSPSPVTAVMTRRAFDIRTRCRSAHSYVLRHVIPMS